MSMMKIAKFLRINRSVDGAQEPTRWFQLPESRRQTPYSLLSKQVLSAGFVNDLKSTPRGSGTVRDRGAPIGILF